MKSMFWKVIETIGLLHDLGEWIKDKTNCGDFWLGWCTATVLVIVLEALGF